MNNCQTVALLFFYINWPRISRNIHRHKAELAVNFGKAICKANLSLNRRWWIICLQRCVSNEAKLLNTHKADTCSTNTWRYLICFPFCCFHVSSSVGVKGSRQREHRQSHHRITWSAHWNDRKRNLYHCQESTDTLFLPSSLFSLLNT